MFEKLKNLLIRNVYNEAFLKLVGNGYTTYDYNSKSYLDKGYNINPDVYACVKQMTDKTVSVPYTIKRVEDKNSYNKLKALELATKGQKSLSQQITINRLLTKAFKETELPLPLERPNELQTWSEVIALYKTYMRLTGNCYFYLLCPQTGRNKDVPIQLYVLPAHLIQIVLKANPDMLGVESPIDYYTLIEGSNYIRFDAKDIIHVKYPNPNFDFNGEHLYGMSPLRAALRNINSQNSAIDLGIQTLQNGGAFGFVHGKASALTQDQADSLKQRLVEMQSSNAPLGRIAGASAEVGFTRISLTADELKPFSYLDWDRKSICNVLGWSDELLNNDGKAKLGNTDTNAAMKRAITDNILPDLKMLEDAFNQHFLPRFTDYQNCVWEWDISELPEMQEDMAKMVEWLDKMPITPNEFRVAMKWETIETEEMNVVWINSGKQRIDDISDNDIQQI